MTFTSSFLQFSIEFPWFNCIVVQLYVEEDAIKRGYLSCLTYQWVQAEDSPHSGQTLPHPWWKTQEIWKENQWMNWKKNKLVSLLPCCSNSRKEEWNFYKFTLTCRWMHVCGCLPNYTHRGSISSPTSENNKKFTPPEKSGFFFPTCEKGMSLVMQ